MNTEKMKELLMASVNAAIKDSLDEFTPVEAQPYCTYATKKDSFFISTTDDDSFDAYIPFDEVIDIFIENNLAGTSLRKDDVQPFIDKLRAAADLIESKIG
jgi:hypothetical protein